MLSIQRQSGAQLDAIFGIPQHVSARVSPACNFHTVVQVRFAQRSVLKSVQYNWQDLQATRDNEIAADHLTFLHQHIPQNTFCTQHGPCCRLPLTLSGAGRSIRHTPQVLTWLLAPLWQMHLRAARLRPYPQRPGLSGAQPASPARCCLALYTLQTRTPQRRLPRGMLRRGFSAASTVSGDAAPGLVSAAPFLSFLNLPRAPKTPLTAAHCISWSSIASALLERHARGQRRQAARTSPLWRGGSAHACGQAHPNASHLGAVVSPMVSMGRPGRPRLFNLSRHLTK